jgi:hypothetical protein
MANTADSLYISDNFKDLVAAAKRLREAYLNGSPFPHITLDNFFNREILQKITSDFPDLSKDESATRFADAVQIKLASGRGDYQQSDLTKNFLRYLNSSTFLDFLQSLTSITEPIIPDPHFLGGGLHEIKSGGLLKIHSDFCRHSETNLDRRINLLIYLNEDWLESYGGHLQLWDKDMKSCQKKILPVFNRVVIFTTTDFTYHGHPDPVTCPSDRSRKSVALYYYTNGRPKEELRSSHWNQSTLFKERPGEDFLIDSRASTAKMILRSITPPFIFPLIQRLKP